MAGFKDNKTTAQLKQGYDDKIYVYLESTDDYQIIARRWFKSELKDGELQFIAADTVFGSSGGGCEAVIRIVNDARNNNRTAYGIVDRDVLHSDSVNNWDLWWEEDDNVFQSQNPCGNYIRVLLRWELENYLLDVDALEASIADTPPLTDMRTHAEAANDVLQFHNELKNKSAATVVLVSHQEEGLNPGFGCNPRRTGDELRQDIETHLEKKGISEAKDALGKERNKIDRFDDSSLSSIDRWESLIRMLDGKAALKYLGCMLKVPFDKKRGELARRMKEAGRVPQEIQGYIAEFKQA